MNVVIEASNDTNIQPFKDISEAFLKKAQNNIDKHSERLAESDSIFRRTLDFYKYIPKTGSVDKCTPSQFFELWSKFAADFRDIWKREINAINAEM